MKRWTNVEVETSDISMYVILLTEVEMNRWCLIHGTMFNAWKNSNEYKVMK